MLIATPDIHFLKVATVSGKLHAVCAISKEQFLKKQRLLIAVPDEISCTYIDQLLWRIPEESFLPHAVLQTDNDSLVCITMSSGNLNKAHTLLNLCPFASPIAAEFKLIFELLDETDAEKKRAAQAKYKAYQDAGYSIKIHG